MRTLASFVIPAALLAASCGGDDDDTPPPVTNTAPHTTPHTPPAPPGQVMVTVVANSTPPGAMVTGGGRQLGTTPLTAQVPIPAPRPGEVQTFAFTFELTGHQSATVNASPVNNAINITAALAPEMPAPVVNPEPVGGDGDGDDDGDTTEIRINGQGGGPIFDHNTTTGWAVVEQDCTIDRARVRLNGNHTFFRDLHITVRDPNNRSYSLARGVASNPFRTHTLRGAAGRQARGRWSLAIADRLNADSGNLRGWTLLLRCR